MNDLLQTNMLKLRDKTAKSFSNLDITFTFIIFKSVRCYQNPLIKQLDSIFKNNNFYYIFKSDIE